MIVSHVNAAGRISGPNAKAHGGDAVILTNSDAVTKGYVSSTQTNATTTPNTAGNFNASTSGNSTSGTFGATTVANDQSNSTAFAAPIEQQHTKYAVIKYLTDDSGDARATAP